MAAHRPSRAKNGARGGQKVVLNAGSGSAASGGLPPYFESWRELRVDLNPSSNPDIVASIVDLREIPDGSVDAVWSSHCVEHLLPHEVPLALAEFRRVLSRNGFTIIIVPDLQAIAEWIAEDRLHEIVYESPSGPVTAHDMLWGYGPALERGDLTMAHRCGFTPTLLVRRLQVARFPHILLRRRSTWELAALMLRSARGGPQETMRLMTEIGL